MADNVDNSQMSFDTDLSELNKFMQSLQQFINQSNSASPQVQKLTSLFNELNQTILTLNTTFLSLKNSSNLTSNFNSMISVINTLKGSFSGIEGGARGLNSFVSNIDRISNSVQSLSSLSSRFNEFKSEISDTPKVSNNQILSFINKLQTALESTINSFNALQNVSNQIQSLNTLLNDLISTFDKLNSLSLEFNDLMKSSKTPVSLQTTENYFTKLISLVERLNVLYTGLSNSVGGLEPLTEGVSKLQSIMQILVSTTEQFNQLIQNTGATGSINSMTAYFNGLMTTISNVDNEFKSVLGDINNISNISREFMSVRTAMSNLVGIANQLDSALQKTTTIPDMGSMEKYFITLAETIARLDVEFQNFAGVNKNLENVSATFKDLNKTVTQMQRITTKLGTPEDIQRMDTAFTALASNIQKLVTEINSLNLDTGKFAQLNDMLRNTSTIMKTVSSSSNGAKQSMGQMNEGVNQFKNGVSSLNEKNQGFLSIFTSSFGPSPVNMLSKMHMGINNIRFGVEGLIMSLGGRELWNWLIGTNQQIEVLQSSLEVTLKSAQKAADEIRNLRSYAALTPFQELETFQAGEMLAANRMDIDKWIRVAGDLASAKKTAGVELNDVINVLTRINSGDFGKAMIRLRQMGISLNDLREKGLSFTKNNTYKGTTDEMLNAIQDIIQERYGGLTEKLGQTTEGLISTIKDFFLQLGIQMGDLSFKKLRSWLKDVKSDLQEFQNSTEFKKIISGFNEFVDQMQKFLAPFASVIAELAKVLAENLPLLGRLIQFLITQSLIKNGLTIIQNLITNAGTLKTNWSLINLEAQKQIDSLGIENKLINDQAVSLAKLNALRKAGTNILNEQTAAQAVQTELSAVGYGKTKTGVQPKPGDASFIGPLSATQLAASKSAQTGATLTSIGTKLGAVASKVLLVTAVMQILGSTVSAVAEGFKKHDNDLSNSVDDYDRIIGQQVEEVKTLQDLNDERIKANQNIQYYSDLQQKASQDSQNLTFTEEQKLDITGKLNDSQQQLIRLNDQLIEIAPDMVGALSSVNGQLTDETGAFDQNTIAIMNNINARKQKIAVLHAEQVEQAKAEISLLQGKIQSSNDIADQVKNAGTGRNIAGGFAKGINNFFKIFGIDPLGTVLSEDQKTTFDLISGSESDRQSYYQQSKINNLDYADKIRAYQDTINEDQTAKSKGFVLSNGDADIEAYRSWKKKQDEKLQDTEKKLSATPQTFQDELSNSTTGQKRIAREYDIRLQQELARNGNDTNGDVYQQIENEKAAALQGYIDSSIKDIQDIYNRAKSGWDIKLGNMSSALKTLMDSDIDPEQIISALNDGNDGIVKLAAGRQDIASNLLKLYNDLQSKGLKADDIRVATREYDTFKEAQQAYQDTLDELNLSKAQALVKSMDKASKESALQKFNDQWNQQKEQIELKKDIALQRDQISGYDENSAVYNAHRKQQDYTIMEFITNEINALKEQLNNGVIKDAKEKYQAQTQLLQLDKERNSLLLDIKKNTMQASEFNKPGTVNAITYYDYKAKDAQSSTIEIGDAKFVMQVQSLQTIDDVQKMMDVIKKYLGTFVKQTESSGYVNPNKLT